MRSPLQLSPEAKKRLLETRMMAQMFRTNQDLAEIVAGTRQIDELRELLIEGNRLSQQWRDQLERVYSLPQGEKGDSIRGPQGVPGREGRPGKTPVKGVDYLTESEVKEIARLASTFVQNGKDGKDATINKEKLADDVVNLILKKKKLRQEHIQGLSGQLATYRHQLAMKQAGQHGGGDTIAAGSGITLTRNANGTTTVAATGATIASETPVGAVDGSNTSYTVSNEPLFIIADGSFRVSGQGYTYAAGTITMDALIPPVQFIRSYYAA